MFFELPDWPGACSRICKYFLVLLVSVRLLQVIPRVLVLRPSISHRSLHYQQAIFPVACVPERVRVGAAELRVELSRPYEVSLGILSAFLGL